jgi:hypothetical protein
MTAPRPMAPAPLSSTPFIPRPALLGAGALLATVLVLTMIAGPMKREAPVPSLSIAQQPGVPLQRELRFTDGADSSVQVIDGRSGALIEAVHGEQGFLRGVLVRVADQPALLHHRLQGDGPLDMSPMRAEWDAMMAEYEGDNNHDHFHAHRVLRQRDPRAAARAEAGVPGLPDQLDHLRVLRLRALQRDPQARRQPRHQGLMTYMARDESRHAASSTCR